MECPLHAAEMEEEEHPPFAEDVEEGALYPLLGEGQAPIATLRTSSFTFPP